MVRTVLLVALVCAIASLSAKAQLCVPSDPSTLGPCEQCGVVPKDQGAECETDTNACTVQECDGESSAESACVEAARTECNDPPICTSSTTCDAVTGECEYPFNAADTECTNMMAGTCMKFECQQDSTTDSIDCVEVNVDNTTPCTPTTPEPCTDYECVDGICQGTPRCLDCETCVSNVCEPNCNSPPACEGNGACVAGMGGAADVCEYSFADDPSGCPDAPVCQVKACSRDTEGGGSCTTDADTSNDAECVNKVLPMDKDAQCNAFACTETNGGTCEVQTTNEGGMCDDMDPCTENDKCVGGTCQGTPKCTGQCEKCNTSTGNCEVDSFTPCDPGLGDGAQCFCTPDSSGNPQCNLCLSKCPDTKGSCNQGSPRFCAEEESSPGQATCGANTCTILCQEACKTTRTYASSDCNNKGGCSCKGISSIYPDGGDFTGPCCRCTAC